MGWGIVEMCLIGSMLAGIALLVLVTLIRQIPLHRLSSYRLYGH
jgi:hypothetical protein